MARKLLVEGLDWGVTDAGLRQTFEPFGHVVEVRIAQDWETGRSRGFGHVTFEDDMAAQLAIQTMDGARLAGKVIRVMFAPDESQGGIYRGGDYGRVDGAPQGNGDYRGGDYSDGRNATQDRRVYRSADFGYADGPTGNSAYRSADFDGGRRRTPTRELGPPPLEADAEEAAAAKADPAAEPEDAATAKGPKRGGAHRDAKDGWRRGSDNEGVGGAGKKTFG